MPVGTTPGGAIKDWMVAKSTVAKSTVANLAVVNLAAANFAEQKFNGCQLCMLLIASGQADLLASAASAAASSTT